VESFPSGGTAPQIVVRQGGKREDFTGTPLCLLFLANVCTTAKRGRDGRLKTNVVSCGGFPKEKKKHDTYHLGGWGAKKLKKKKKLERDQGFPVGRNSSTQGPITKRRTIVIYWAGSRQRGRTGT